MDMLGEALGVNMPPKENSEKTGGDGKDPGKKKEDPGKEGGEKVKETGTRRKTTRNKGGEGGNEKDPDPSSLGAAGLFHDSDAEEEEEMENGGEERSALRTARATAKGKLTRFRDKLSTKKTVPEKEAAVEMILHLFNEFCVAHKAVGATFVDAVAAERDDLAYDDVISNTENALALARGEIASLKEEEQRKKDKIKRELQAEAAEAMAAAVKKNKSGPKLNGFELKKFDGSFEKFPSWWSTFEAIVDRNDEYSDQIKFGLLKTYVTGAAALTLEKYEVIPENYEAAKRQLKERFGRPRVIRKRVIKKMAEYKPKDNSASEARKTLDVLTGYMRTLSSVRVDIGARELATALIPFLEDKFPEEARLEFEKWLCSQTDHFQPTLDQFITQIQRALEPLLNGERAQSSTPVVKATALVAGAKQNGKKGGAAAKEQGGKRRPEKTEPPQKGCLFCGGEGHRAADCPEGKKMAVDQRWAKVNEAGACYACLTRGHQVRQCSKKVTCSKEGCSKIHHDLLHG